MSHISRAYFLCPTFFNFKESEVIGRMETKIWEEKHRQIDYRLDVAEKRLDNHSERLDRIELINGRLEERLKSLIKQLESLNTTMRWFMGLMIGTLLGFFIWYIQRL